MQRGRGVEGGRKSFLNPSYARFVRFESGRGPFWSTLAFPRDLAADRGPFCYRKNVTGNRKGLFASLFALVLLPTAITAALVRAAFQRASSADPSQAAHLVVDGISQAMNYGLAISLLALVPTIVFGVCVYREAKRTSPSE